MVGILGAKGTKKSLFLIQNVTIITLSDNILKFSFIQKGGIVR